MPTTPYAKLLASVNGGIPTGGAITSGAYGDTIQLTAESTAQWDLTTPPRWEIYSYPPGWTGPASGWTTESVEQPFGGTADVYVYTGLGPPPAFNLPADPLWGKWLFKLTVQGGLLNGIPTNTLIDDTLAIEIVSPNGFHDTATLEGTQFSTSRAWSGDVQENWRTVDEKITFILENLSAPSEASFVAGRASNDLTTDYSIAFRTFNPAVYNETNRTITFRAWLRVTSGATASLELYNVTAGATVHTFTSTSAVGESKSQVLTVPTNLPNSIQSYELRLKRTGGSPGDVAECFSALLEIAYP